MKFAGRAQGVTFIIWMHSLAFWMDEGRDDEIAKASVCHIVSARNSPLSRSTLFFCYTCTILDTPFEDIPGVSTREEQMGGSGTIEISRDEIKRKAREGAGDL
jgi:hypothetical protein